jgi:adenine deaminase
VLPRGTTTAICDPHELANVQGISGIRYFLEAADRARMNLFVMLSSCVPATHLETNGGGTLSAEDLLSVAHFRNALGLAEVMNVPGVLNGDPAVMAKLAAFTGRPIDGHAPLVTGPALSAYACAGITSCHESSDRHEAEEKLGKGIAVWIREGSVAKDLAELAPLLTAHSSAAMGFCTDDRNPLDISEQGHVDYLLRRSLALGIAPETVYRAASWSVARHYGLDRLSPSRPYRIGAVAPGYQADLVVLDEVSTCAIHSVYKAGVDVRALSFATESATGFGNSVRASAPGEEALRGPAGPVHVIRVLPGKILTERHVADAADPTLARLSVVERYGRGLPPANAYVSGFGASFRGAIASSVGHDSHNLITVGRETSDMKVALARLIEMGGGFCVVQNGKVIADLALPLGGLMSPRPADELVGSLRALREASRAVGCVLEEPFLQLAFLSLPVIPSLKLTDRGLVDVEKFAIIDVRAS